MSRECEAAHIMCPKLPPDGSGRTLKCFTLAVPFPAWSLVISWPEILLDDVTHPETHRVSTHLLKQPNSAPGTIPHCWGFGPSRTHIHTWWEYKMAQARWKTAWQLLIKVNMLLLDNPATIWVFTQKIWELMYTWMLLATVLIIAKT